MEECESLDSEMRELQGFQSETSDTNSQDDQDEVEELQNSLREVVQDPSVKPKLQCLMVDPSFSMVTVQSEDSGIVWETASSRCSTPWASETSSTSEGYSMDGSGAAGKITIVFDEEKIVRRRTRSGGRSSRLGDRLSRPGSSRSASVLGKERPEMAEVSLPNIKPEPNKADPDLEEIKSKDQQLFSLISEGYEILNIRVPSKLPTVDEEENTELQDNLSYLNLSPKIKSRNHFDWTQQQDHVPTEETQDHQEPPKQEEETESAPTPTPKDTIGDIDYFEKFTLLDEVVPIEQSPKQQEEAGEPAGTPREEEQKPVKDTATDNPSASEESFVFVTDVDIVEEHLDEVFYGEGPLTDAHHHREEDETRRRRRESQRSRIGSGSVLFGSEQTTLTPIYISPGPPKIIDQILLEEPTAMSFMYSDLYEDAMGERGRSNQEHSGAESVASERFYKRRSSDEAPDGYLEKFTLKDETPTVDIQSDPVEENREGRMMWPQSTFELTGCLIRAEKEDEKEKTEEAKMQEGSVGDKSEELPSAVLEDKKETVAETEKEVLQVPAVAEEQLVRASEDIIEECKPTEEKIDDQQVKEEVKSDQIELPEDRREKSEVHQEDSTIEDRKEREDLQEEKKETVAETEKAAENLPASAVIGNQVIRQAAEVESRQMEEKMEDQQVTVETEQTKPPDLKKLEADEENYKVEKRKDRVEYQEEKEIICQKSNAQVLIEALDQTTANTEFPPVITKSEMEEVSHDDKMVADEGQLPSETKKDASAEVKEPESEQQEPLTLTEPPAEVEALPDTSSSCKAKEAVEVIAEDIAPVEVVTDSDSTVHTVVEVTEKAMNETEIQTQVQIDLQEAMSTEEIDVQKVLPDREEVHKSHLKGKTTEKLPMSINEDVIALQDLEGKSETSSEITEPVMAEVFKLTSDDKQQEIVETEQLQPEMTENESDLAILITEDKSKQPTEDNGSSVQDIMNVGDELIVFVPKGQAVEMDVEISHWSENAAEHTPTEPENRPELQAPTEEAKPGPPGEVEPEVSVMKHLALIDSDRVCQQQEDIEEPITDKQELEQDSNEDTVISPMRSFSPLEDLSELHTEDVQSEDAGVEQKSHGHEVVDEPETAITKESIVPDIHLHREDVEEKTEQEGTVTEAPEMSLDDLEYEVITEQDAKEMQEAEAQRDAKPELVLKQDEAMDAEKEEMIEAFLEEEELIEADYEIIDAEEENQARLAAELQGMDWFCVTCGCLLSEQDCGSAEHHHHKVETVDKAYEGIKETLSDWISELQGRSENIEDLVSELELAYNSVEDHCVESEAAMQAQNDEMMALVMEQYNNMSISMEEEKKAKLEQLYDQIVSFQESIDSTKTTLETTSREAETDARSPEDIQERLEAALDSVLSLELGPKGLLVFQDYAKANTSSSNLTQRKGIPVPQRPTLQPQEPGSASSTSVTVYWNVNPGDIIDCFQVYCMEDPHGAISEEYRVTVKESYCVLEELDPDKVYKVWVMAVNYTGCSLPSDRLVFKTAPSVPAIDTERCTVLWDSATLRWSSPQQTAGQSYTLEYCRQYELEGEGLRSIAGIKVCKQKVLLQPNENYLFYIKAVNEAGVSEQSEAALISTKGMRFHLLKESAHPGLELSEDHTVVHYSQDAHKAAAASDKQCPSILGDLLPPRGLYYWETTVSGCAAYRLGVAYSTVNTNSSLGEDCLSWCLQCIPSPSGCRYQLLHNDVQSTVFVTEMPERVGVLLDYQLGRLLFYNAQGGQLLGSFTQSFTQPCHPALGLELPGSLGVSMVLEVPEFTRDS